MNFQSPDLVNQECCTCNVLYCIFIYQTEFYALSTGTHCGRSPFIIGNFFANASLGGFGVYTLELRPAGMADFTLKFEEELIIKTSYAVFYQIYKYVRIGYYRRWKREKGTPLKKTYLRFGR